MLVLYHPGIFRVNGLGFRALPSSPVKNSLCGRRPGHESLIFFGLRVRVRASSLRPGTLVQEQVVHARYEIRFEGQGRREIPA